MRSRPLRAEDGSRSDIDAEGRRATDSSVRTRFHPRPYLTHLTYLTYLTVCCIITQSASSETPLLNKSAHSVSGQFIGLDRRPHGPSDLALSLSTDPQFVCLDPGLLAVSCERTKQYLASQLGAGLSWRGKIFLALHGAESRDETIGIMSERFPDGWQYRVDLPDVTEKARYVRAIVQVLLLEMANRNGPQRSAELPLWLVEGLTRQLLASHDLEIILPAPGRKANNISINSAIFESRRRQDSLFTQRDEPLAHARNVLRSNAVFTFEQLSWPLEDQLVGEQREVFCCSAQLFVTELLRMNGGQAGIREMLVQLPDFYNWQLAFLRAFPSAFARLLDVEKWWTLQWVNFTGTEAAHTWPLEASWQKLADTLRSSVEVRAGADQLPLRTEVTLQTIIRDWDAETQNQELQSRLRQLDLMRLRLDPRVVPLLDQYRQVLEVFLKNSNPSGLTAALGKKAAIKNAKDQAVKDLDFLDTRRLSVEAQLAPVAKAKSAPPTPQE
jgi:hypothetical protein